MRPVTTVELTRSQNSITTVVDFDGVGNTKVVGSINASGALAGFASSFKGSMGQDIVLVVVSDKIILYHVMPMHALFVLVSRSLFNQNLIRSNPLTR